MSGKTDAYGNTTNNNNGGDYNPTIKEVTETAPTSAPVSGMTAPSTSAV